ncbi:hypothetical protein FACS1894159_10500 [Bacteroidia bacterium]|nr:hypothetical protein FACS1894159_10500 [Bacteroidia bacterium]
MERTKLITDNQVLFCQSSLIDELLKHGVIADEDITIQEDDKILEWWLVTSWLAKQLEERSQTIIHAFDCCFWGRTTSGQAIYLDNVIREIAQR